MTPAAIAHRFAAEQLHARPDDELLARYIAEADDEAFAILVQRFVPLVLAACRRVLGPSADTDDAFQNVFIALARKAAGFRDAKVLPAWLHRVSLRVAHKALARRTVPGLTKRLETRPLGGAVGPSGGSSRRRSSTRWSRG